MKLSAQKFVWMAAVFAMAVNLPAGPVGAQTESSWKAVGGIYAGYHTVEANNQAGDFEYKVDTRSGDLEGIVGLFLDGWANRWGGVFETSWVNEDYDDQLYSDRVIVVNGTLEQQMVSAEGFAYFSVFGAEKDSPIDVLVGLRGFFVRSKIHIFSNQTQFGTIDIPATISANWYDPTIGLRWKTSRVNEFWAAIRGDVGGFSVGSDISWQVRAEAGLRLTDVFDLMIGVKHTDIDYDNGESGTDFYSHNARHSNFLIVALFRFQ